MQSAVAAALSDSELLRTRFAAAVCCSDWILIMASMGWAGGLSQGFTGSRLKLVPTWDFQERVYRPDLDAGSSSDSLSPTHRRP